MRTVLFVVVALGLSLCVGADMGAQPGGKGGGGPGSGPGGGPGGAPFGKKKGSFGTDPSGTVVVQPGSPVRIRWEYHSEVAGAVSTVKLNDLGAEGWELTAIDLSARSYIFRRPGTGEVKVQPKPGPETAPEKKTELRNEIRLYALKNANAVELVQLLDEVLRVSKGPVMRVVAEPRSNQIIVNAPIEVHAQIIALLDRLDVPSDNERPKGLKKKGPTFPGDRP